MNVIKKSSNVPAMEEGPKLKFDSPESSRPGVALRLARFTEKGGEFFPFEGGCFTVEPNCTSRPDTHAVRECWMVARGKGMLTYDGKNFTIEAGDYLYFEPHRTHQVHNDFNETLVIYTVWWES